MDEYLKNRLFGINRISGDAIANVQTVLANANNAAQAIHRAVKDETVGSEFPADRLLSEMADIISQCKWLLDNHIDIQKDAERIGDHLNAGSTS